MLTFPFGTVNTKENEIKLVKSIRWMPWNLGPKKDVVACDKPRGAGKQAMIRGYPNGETR